MQVYFHYKNSELFGLLDLFPWYSSQEDMAANKTELIFTKYGTWNNSPCWRA